MNMFLNRFNLSLIIVTYSVLVVALYTQLSIFVVFLGAGCAIWRIGHFYGRLIMLPRLLLSLVAILSSLVTVILLYSQGVFSILFHLIFLGFSLKFLELKSVRDIYFFVNTGLVLLALFFIYNSALFSTFIASLILLLLLAILLSLHSKTLRHSEFVNLLLKSCLLSLPLAVLLFVVMPRIPSLWKMPLQKQATTGLSDSVSPGEIANLSRSSALAFRATFNDSIVPASERYWRAMTLDQFNGKTWSQSVSLKQQESEARTGRLTASNISEKLTEQYELLIEPHYNYWLPVLDYSFANSTVNRLNDYSLRSLKPVVTRASFLIAKRNSVKTPSLTSTEIAQFTQLPAGGNRQTDNWISEHLDNGVSKTDVLMLLLTGFSERFRYTLQPPLLGEHQVDDFLFNSKAGFCVHFASSYLYVARRLGIPSRMVTGYLGGEWQVSERFLTVRQYDAHAWVEIWTGEQWQRIDPTAYVAPERVESGLEAGLTDTNEFLAGEFFSLHKWRGIELINAIRNQFAQLDYLWARYIVNFDNQKQLNLLQRWVSFMPWLSITYAVMAMMSLIFVGVILAIFKPWQGAKKSLEDKIYLNLQNYFKKSGLMREKGQTVSGFCNVINEKCGLSQTLCEGFANEYNKIKYQPDLSPEQYKKQIQQLNYISKALQNENKKREL